MGNRSLNRRSCQTFFLRNEGQHYQDESAISGAALRRAAMHRGAAFGDLNNDGRIDVVTISLNDRPEILLNESSPSEPLADREAGRQQEQPGRDWRQNQDSAGKGPRQYNHVTTSVGLASSSDRRVHFGLGLAKAYGRLRLIGRVEHISSA